MALSYAGILLVYGNSPEARSSDITMGAFLVLACAVEFALFMIGVGT